MNEIGVARAAEFVESAANCVLSLIDSGGYPTAATITPSMADGIRRLYFGNNVESNWVKRARNCGRASICFHADKPEVNITLVGDIEILSDLPVKQAMWRDWMAMYYSGPEDPSFCVLRFIARRYSIFIDGTQLRGAIE